MSVWVISARATMKENAPLQMDKTKATEQNVFYAAPVHVFLVQGGVSELWAGKQEESPVVLRVCVLD